MRFIFTLVMSSAPFLALATPGAVDQYDCHRDIATSEYHCHGDSSTAKQNHFLIGVTSINDAWLYSNGPMNVFSGGALEFEAATGFVGLHGSWGYQTHVTGANTYKLYGWDAGLKVGPNISRIGLHPYAEVGYFGTSFSRPNAVAYPLSGLQYGAGLVLNKPTYAIDLRILNRATSELEIMWTSLGAPGTNYYLRAQLGVYLRF
jgi:hypothetical protein